MTCSSSTWKRVKGSSQPCLTLGTLQLPPRIRAASYCLMLEVPGDMTQKGELVLTASPGERRGTQSPGRLCCPPAAGAPAEAPKPSAQHPNPARPPRSGAASVHSSRHPRPAQAGSSVSGARGARQPPHLPCLPAAGTGGRPQRSGDPSAPPRTGGPRSYRDLAGRGPRGAGGFCPLLQGLIKV